jgi:CBS domain-containing protein
MVVTVLHCAMKEDMMSRKKEPKPARTKEFGSMSVGQVMEKKVQCASLTTKADVIASMMVEGFGAVPVITGKRKLAGIVSEHDLLAALDDGHSLRALTAGDIMTGHPYSIPSETTLATLVHVLRASDLVRVPVVDAKDKLIGIVARRDVLRTYLASGVSRNTK